MKIFIAGATGVLGRRLIQQFGTHGHSVLGLVRSARGEQIVQALGGETRRADLFNSDALAGVADGADVVIHAATAIPVKPRLTPSDWEMNDRIGRDGTRALATCAGKIGAKSYIQQSIVWVARPPDGSPFDEDSPPNPDPVTSYALDGETIASEVGERFNFTISVLRCGWFYGADAAHTKLFGESLARRRLPIIGRGDAIWALLHLDDAASAFVAAAEASRTGVWHVVDDQAVTVSDFLTGFAERLGVSPPRRIPVWLARLVAGQHAVNFFGSSTRTSNARLRSEVGWTPRFPSFREGLDQIIRTWKSEGFLNERK